VILAFIATHGGRPLLLGVRGQIGWVEVDQVDVLDAVKRREVERSAPDGLGEAACPEAPVRESEVLDRLQNPPQEVALLDHPVEQGDLRYEVDVAAGARGGHRGESYHGCEAPPT
jgi:hypothetical protein